MPRFRQVAELLRKRIDAGLIAPGDKLPSLRRLAGETGCSVVTVYRAYELLESQGLCQARDRSGFYASTPTTVRFQPLARDMPVMPADDVRALDESLAGLPVQANAAAAMLPTPGLIGLEGMNRLLRRALLHSGACGELPDDGPGQLISALVQRAGRREQFIRPDQVLITRSAIESFNLCLDSLGQRGGPVLVESPSYYPVLESLRHRGIKALEIYSHPRLGIDPEQFAHILKSTGVRLCVLMGCNRIPTGVTYSRTTLARLVEAARQHDAIILENDLTAPLGHGELRSPSLKEFDSDDHVVPFAGTATWLSGAYEIGWIMAGKHMPQLSATHHLSGAHPPPSAVQAALAQYLNGRQSERDLRRAGETLKQRMHQGIELLKAASAGRVAISQPDGGYLCWVRGPRDFDAMQLAMAAGPTLFDFIPGPFFSPAGAFSNFMALNFSAPWTPERIEKLRRLCARVFPTMRC